MSEFSDFHATRVPDWATQLISNPEDFERVEIRVFLEPYALAHSPDAFRWHVEQELDAVRRSFMAAYYEQHGMSPSDPSLD